MTVISSPGVCELHKVSSHFQELLSLAKRKRVDSGEQEEPVSKPAASTDSETSDSDDEVGPSWSMILFISV